MRRDTAVIWWAMASGLAACFGGEPEPARPPTPDVRAWTARSLDGRAVLASAPAGLGCQLTSTVGGAVAWQAEGCVASSRDLVFVAPDGERFLVLFTSPTQGARSWEASLAAAAYRRGAAGRWLTAAELIGAGRLAAARQEAGWLRGAGTETGPRYTPDGRAVALTVAGGADVTLGFEDEGTPGDRAPRAGTAAGTSAAQAPAPGQAEASGPPPESIWAWEDRQGQLHYERWADLSPQARRVARPVNATVGEVSGGRTPARRSVGLPPDLAARPPAGLPRSSPPDLHKGPRLNGLTDGERAALEREAQLAADRKRAEDGAGWARQREMAEKAWGARPGAGTFRVNQAEQECTRTGDIVECRDKVRR